MAGPQDSTSVTVSELDPHAIGERPVAGGNDGFRFDQATQTDQPPGPEPSNGPPSKENTGG